MIAMVLVVVPGGFAFAVWRVYAKARKHPGGFVPEGKLRWENRPDDPGR